MGLAAAAAADAEAVALLQREVKLHEGAASPSCECLGWKDAYAKHGAACGAGHEMDVVDGMPGLTAAKMVPQLGFEFCAMYFRQLPNDGVCMNNKFAASPAEWCYVSKDCAEGAPIEGGYSNTSTPVRTKKCSRGQDATLGQMKFEELAAYAYKNNMELGLMVQYAYPTWDGDKLPDMQAFWGLQAPSDATRIREKLRERLRAQVSSGKTVFITSRNGHPPFGVSEGEKLYYINTNPAHFGFDKKRDMNLWACVAGCGEANNPLW